MVEGVLLSLFSLFLGLAPFLLDNIFPLSSRAVIPEPAPAAVPQPDEPSWGHPDTPFGDMR